MRPRARIAATAATLLVLAGACTSAGSEARGPNGDDSAGTPPSLVPASPEDVSSVPEGPGSAAAALRRLCTLPEPDLDAGSDVPAEGPTPPVIAELMGQLERIRGFGFTSPVVAEPATQREVGSGYVEYLDETYPEEFYERRSVAWQTIGVIPAGASIREALRSYGTSQVIGYYDTITGELVFVGTEDPSPLERITLAHELTHAIDDQRFGLESVDALGAECRDEELSAILALVEGNATFFMLRWAQTFLTLEEQLAVGVEAAEQGTPRADVPPFIEALQLWPYDEGLRFVTSLDNRGGIATVDGAFSNLPVSTEQIIHPERYPNDVPTPLDVPDLSQELGRRWKDLDVQGVGESWLAIALKLRLDPAEAGTATAGWDGGLYRAWSDGEDVAVVLETVWDSTDDAAQFASAMERWIDAGDALGAVLDAEGASVRVLFASDPDTLESLRAAV